ncbi:MAG TPA: fused MFS/spermidine synthase [Vicinamibacterales bacterium]
MWQAHYPDAWPSAMGLTVLSMVVWLLFAASGASALVYEIVWQQLLQLVIGSSTVSLGVLLAVFMGGLCFGSLYAPRLGARDRHPLRVYAALELAIGACGLALLAVMPLVERFYTTWGGEGAAGLLLRTVVAAACLLPPTFAMGATLPILSRWLESTSRGSSLGMFYAANLLGAVTGCVAAGFYLLRVYDMNVATYVAVGINVLVSVVALVLVRLKPDTTTEKPRAPNPETRVPNPEPLVPVLIGIALSGFCALAAEVVWTRMLSLIFGATVYTFSLILAVFLIGLGGGSAIGNALSRRLRRPAVALGWCQWLSVGAMLWSAEVLARWLPYWPATASASAVATFQTDMIRALIAILPAPTLWGASFSLALASNRSEGDPAIGVGRIYAANTVGAIVGALLTSLLLVAWIGTGHTEQVMMGAAALSGAVVFWPHARPRTRSLIAASSVAMLALAAVVPPLPGLLVAYGRHAAAWADQNANIIYVGEGLHASIAVSRVSEGVLNYHNAGKIQASSEPSDMRLQRMLGHLTTLVPRQARSVLVIGCGAGVTAGAVSVNPNVERVTIVEIEPLVPQAAGRYFGGVNHDVLRNPKVHVVVDDARHFLMTTHETFDAITSDPLDPWVKGAATLYTKEFFDTARAHLNPGGAMTLFVQLYESSADAVKSEVATFFKAFPEGLIFGNTYNGAAFDTVLVGPVAAPEIDLEAIDGALRLPAFERMARSLGEIGMYSAHDLFSNYAGRAKDLQGWIGNAQINRDRNLRLQYLAGSSLNVHDGDRIYRDIVSYRIFPDDLFVGNSTTLWSLKQAIEGARE